MLELVNLSNYASDLEIIQNDAAVLKSFLAAHSLAGVEMMFCNPWDNSIHPQAVIKGAHLRFWPNWLDFWLGNQESLLQEFGDIATIKTVFGGMNRENLLAIYKENIETALSAGASYLVFHVSQARTSEIFCRKFYYTSQKVIEETVKLVNELTPFIPPDVMLLFENLWWPGLTLLDKELTAQLLTNINHPAKGLMLDTGHLMNTNHALRTQEEGIAYILATLKNLGSWQSFIRGIHLHYSLSGKYVKKTASLTKNPPQNGSQIMRYVLKVDEHLPFTAPEAAKIIDIVRPEYLVHEFMFTSLAAWSGKVAKQRAALGLVPHNI